METQILNKQHRHLNRNMDRIAKVKPQVTIQIEANGLHELFKKSLKSLANKLKYKIYNPTRHTDCTMKIEVDAINSTKIKYVPENGILMSSETDSLNPFTSSIIFQCEE